MNKRRIDRMIPKAYELLNSATMSKNVDKKDDTVGPIAVDGKIKSSYRGGVSSFGAAVVMGSILSAAAFFSTDSGGASYNRKLLGKVIALTAATELKECNEEVEILYDFVKGHDDSEELILDAAVAVKLAMNLYQLEKIEYISKANHQE